MSYQQVVSVLGREGTVTSHTTIADTTTVMYQWTNFGGLSNMVVMFQDDQLMMKSQFGL
jgi:hypothetical protein